LFTNKAASKEEKVSPFHSAFQFTESYTPTNALLYTIKY